MAIEPILTFERAAAFATAAGSAAPTTKAVDPDPPDEESVTDADSPLAFETTIVIGWPSLLSGWATGGPIESAGPKAPIESANATGGGSAGSRAPRSLL